MNDFKQIALNIDKGLDTADQNRIQSALNEIESLLKNSNNAENSILHYYRANAYSALRKVNPDFINLQYEWQQPELSEEILSLRRSIRCEGFDDLPKIRRCQVYTNLGNNLNTIGRPIEAISAWDKALAIEPTFAMAAGNRANGIAHYSNAIYDPGHQCIFLNEAAKSFRVALNDNSLWDSYYPNEVKQEFKNKLEQIEKYLALNCDFETFDPFAFEVGKNSEAKALNQWRLDNRLFLNPMNDLGAWPIAAQDIFHLPNHTYNIDELPRFPRYYDLISQEFVTACVLLFEGQSSDRVHHSDETLLTYEHGDYSVTSVGLEKQKVAFRMAYSLLDKCAVFVNDYFSLGHKISSLTNTFRKVWFNKNNPNNLNSNLPMKNWRLRGLYSISLDIFDDDFNELSSPLAVKANDIRNAAEHRFLSVREHLISDDQIEACEYVTAEELLEITLYMLQLSRAAIMGLSMAVYYQEKYLKTSSDKLTLPIPGIRKIRR